MALRKSMKSEMTSQIKRCNECGTLLPHDSPAWKKLCLYCYIEKKQKEKINKYDPTERMNYDTNDDGGEGAALDAMERGICKAETSYGDDDQWSGCYGAYGE